MAEKAVILYSGGMDSYCLNKLYPNKDLLYINIDTSDGDFEISILPSSVKIINIPLSQFELENKIIPLRNCFFVMIASQWYSKIYIGATLGDTTKDKDYIFKALMESILNYFGLDFHKTSHQFRPFKVEMPFKELTKTEILKSYLDSGYSPEDIIRESRSCYNGQEKIECGICRSCLRKFIAFKNNRVEKYLAFKHYPTKKEIAKFYLQSVEKNRHQKELNEIEEILLCGDFI